MNSNSICFQRIGLCQIDIGNGRQNINVFDCCRWCEFVFVNVFEQFKLDLFSAKGFVAFVVLFQIGFDISNWRQNINVFDYGEWVNVFEQFKLHLFSAKGFVVFVLLLAPYFGIISNWI